MSVNSAEQTPHSLDECAQVVIMTIGLDPSDRLLHMKVATFIRCNSYLSVWRAADYTRSAIPRYVAKGSPITTPWSYTVRVFNMNLVLLSQLYPLAHWAESGLSSQLDLAYCATRGSSWYRFPDTYLPRALVSNFVQDASMPEIQWETSDRGVARLREVKSSGEFLEFVTFGWLVQMAQFCHKTNNRSILVPPDGKPLPASQVESLLQEAKNARNLVAHNRFLDQKNFLYHKKNLRRLLEVLHFDLDRALARVDHLRIDLRQQLQDTSL